MSKPRMILISLFLILILGGFFRFYKINEIPPGLYPDEAMNGNNALEAIHNTNFSARDGSAFGGKIFYPENNGREGLFINIQALPIYIFGNKPWALRLVSAIFGTLTILGIYLVTRELFKVERYTSTTLGVSAPHSSAEADKKQRSWIFAYRAEIIALLSAFFIAVSFWHINFSRIGFRAIAVPFFATLGLYFLFKGLRQKTQFDLVWAGIFTGLGLHTYIAFRFMPLVFATPLVWYLWQWWRDKQAANKIFQIGPEALKKHCMPCPVILFLFITFVVALPMGIYFLQHPEDFLGRSGQVSIFSAVSPSYEFIKSNMVTLGMFFARGDCNWRHNYSCQTELYWPVGIMFAVGLIYMLATIFRKSFEDKHTSLFLFIWLFVMSLPATLTREGVPHALRSIGMIPPVMIISALGVWFIIVNLFSWFERQRLLHPERTAKLKRIQQEVIVLFILLLCFIPVMTYRTYFKLWAQNPNTYFSFATDIFHLGEYLNDLPNDTKKYVIVNLPGVEVRGIAMPAQTVMFATDTLGKIERNKKNIIYILPSEINTKIIIGDKQKTIISFLNSNDNNLINELKNKFPSLRPKTPSDFVILEN